MKTFTSSQARSQFRDLLDEIRMHDVMVGIGRYNRIEVVMMKYPEHLNAELSDVTNVNTNSKSFDFLKEEPDLYSVDDLKKAYV
jgi:hypothetical protein